ncbi:antitoxin Xre/MbcA/ParS toxin-binding domain-containing protein [Sabulicella rubraurantiaca]|uniref:antitoxin Xre/MbcA/ParS toxin-binding domain-containing protein n=1 Tax=Sabulicella rubraurantiaca TaxID=2811429 RepID=UPI001A96B006|nr:MbcA/ParS/Xre antitoxin family protein [Sabulicella rubraurantiaca]
MARIKAKAADLQTSVEAGEAWIASPAIAFGWRRPADLLTTEEGAEAVETRLMRIDYGAYT